MSNDSIEPEAAEQIDKLRIDRRTAMKAALGGAVAAAAWSAPKIEGLSLSPDYASAGSRTTVNAGLVSPAHNSQTASGDPTECVGTRNAYLTCGNWSPTTKVIPVPTTTESFTLNAVLSGQVKNGGTTAVTMSGITNSNYTCAVTIAGNCAKDNGNIFGGNAGNLNGAGTTTLSTSAPSLNKATTCNGSALYIKSAITINVACIYGTP